ncbi:hypothetical protein [Leucobacter sp. USHLN153]|uniref:hypothetical protein n=1 Tax=Leucobacter sp. USHLN153 TaxID=3081268 RepID=UPI003019C789
MTESPRRGVTRGYVGGLVCAAVIVATALTVAVWGGIALFADRQPVSTESVPVWVAPLLVFIALMALGWGLWITALVLLRGRRSPSWGIIVVLAVGVYLWWNLAGMLGGMSVAETWLSPFAAVLPVIWLIAALLFWAVLARRVYTDRPAPRWPWERHPEDE